MGPSAFPLQAETEDVFVKTVGFCRVGHPNTHVQDVIGNSCIRHVLSETASVDGAAHVLYELYSMAVGIYDRETPVTVAILIDLRRNLNPSSRQKIAKLAGIAGFKADADEAVLIGVFQGWRDLHVLVVVNLEADQISGDTAVCGLKGFGHADNLRIERSRLTEIIDLDGDIGDADNFGAFGRVGGNRNQGGEAADFEQH